MRLPRGFVSSDAADTFRRLDAQTKPRVTAILDHVCANPRYGKPLERELYDCDTAYVVDLDADTGNERPAYRIVYRLRPSRDRPERVEVICIGPRINSLVYDEARAILRRAV